MTSHQMLRACGSGGHFDTAPTRGLPPICVCVSN